MDQVYLSNGSLPTGELTLKSVEEAARKMDELTHGMLLAIKGKSVDLLYLSQFTYLQSDVLVKNFAAVPLIEDDEQPLGWLKLEFKDEPSKLVRLY